AVLGGTTARLFLDQPVKWHWAVATAVAGALAYITNSFFFLQRLTGDFYRMGVCRLVVQVLTTTTLLVVVLLHRSLDGYFIALAASAIVSALVTLPYSQYLWSRASISLLARGVGLAGPDYRRHVRFLVSGNFFGYSKLV